VIPDKAVWSAQVTILLDVNGTSHALDAAGDMPLLWALRDLLQLRGTKFGCGAGLCGACTVQIDGEAQFACQVPISDLAGKRIVTIEGAGASAVGRALQKAWAECDVVQCGYCQPGQIMRAAAMLAATPQPGDAEIDAVMSANLCRCGTYSRIRAAIRRAADEAVA
jgi:isoquinoline 1-oxidoreductase alpha subunit